MEELTFLSPILGLLKFIWSFIKNLPCKVWNLIARPKLIIKFEVKHFQFDDKNGQQKVYFFPFFSICNNTKKQITINSTLTINNSQYHGFPDFHQEDLTMKVEDNEEFMDKHYIENHLAISQGRSFIHIKDGHTKIFPFIRLGSAINRLSEQKGTVSFKKQK